jgi:hypothetical protein
MPHVKLSPRAKEKIADLDEKLTWGLISAHRYDQICDQIMQRDRNARTSEGRRSLREKLESLRERGQISEGEYRIRLNRIQAKRTKARKSVKKPKPVSDPSLSSHMGKPAVFPPGAHSDRIRGRTGWLAKKNS